MAVKGIARELSLTKDAVYGTLEWVSERVSPDVFDKVVVIAEQSVRYGIMKAVINAEKFNDGIEEELRDESL